MAKLTFKDALLDRAKHIGSIIAQVPEWQGTNWTKYNESMPLDATLTESDLVWFFRPGNQRARIEFQDITFKDFGNLKVDPPEEYDKETIVATSKTVDNSKGKGDVVSQMSWSETNTETQEKGFKAALTVGAEVGFEAGTEYAKVSAKISTSATTEWDKRNIASHSETVQISEEITTPPGVHEKIEVILTKNKMREHLTGAIDLEHKVVVVSARPDNSYYYVLVWDTFSDFLRCVDKNAPESWTGARELQKVNLRQINRDCVREPSTALIDTYNKYDNALSLTIRRTPLE